MHGTVFIPADALGAKRLERAIRNEMRRQGKDLLKAHKATTKGWKHTVAFELVDNSGADPSRVEVTTDDEVWNWQDQGTEPHVIEPKNRKFLRFESGGMVVFSKHVNHPGTPARNFTRDIQEQYAKSLPVVMQHAIDAILGSTTGIKEFPF